MLKFKLVIMITIMSFYSIAYDCKLQAGEDNRMVLALYDSKSENIRESNIHLLLEMPLNRLGMVVEYHNINNVSYPDFKKYRAVVVWLSDNISEYGDAYYNYLVGAVDSGVKVILMNGIGITQNSGGRSYQKESANLLKKLGIKEGDIAAVENPFTVQYIEKKKNAFDFEIVDAVEIPKYTDYQIIDNRMTSWMDVLRTDIKGSQSVVVAVGNSGAFISDIELVAKYIDEPVWGILWDLNPFTFLSSALDIENTLKPDTTTTFGLRSAFMHVDGDGSSNMTIDISKESQPCTKVLKERVLDLYPFPISVSAIAYRLTEEGSVGDNFVNIIRDIMRMPLVRPASHTYSHPMDWEKGILGFKILGYTFDPVMETVGSMELIKQTVLPSEKEIKLLLWSGDCNPTEAALAPLYSAGFANLNGGNSRMDSLYQGICHLCPLSIQVGQFRQYYAQAGNEYLYTDEWTKNFGGFSKVIDTFENTKKPRFLPVNVYYHFYITERQAGLNSLLKVYDWCKAQDLCWINVEDYTKVVTGFMSAKTGIEGDGSYYIENYGGLNTVRLDNESRNVDMIRSKNVLGYNHFDDSLYITLLPGDRAEIVLGDSSDIGVYIAKSTGKLRNVRYSKDLIKAEICLYSEGFIDVSGIKGEQFAIINGEKVFGEKMNDSISKFLLPKGNGQWVDFEVSY